MTKRVIWIILDSVGIGELPDAAAFGDVGANTLGNIASTQGGIDIPNMTMLGIGNIDGALNLKKTETPMGCYGKAAEISMGKDSLRQSLAARIPLYTPSFTTTLPSTST